MEKLIGLQLIMEKKVRKSFYFNFLNGKIQKEKLISFLKEIMYF